MALAIIIFLSTQGFSVGSDSACVASARAEGDECAWWWIGDAILAEDTASSVTRSMVRFGGAKDFVLSELRLTCWFMRALFGTVLDGMRLLGESWRRLNPSHSEHNIRSFCLSCLG